MKKVILPLILILVLSSVCFGQNDSTVFWQKAISDSTSDFFEVSSIQDQYFRNHPDAISNESDSRSEFYRWYKFWNHRVDQSDGQIASISHALEKYHNIYRNLNDWYAQSSNTSSDWRFLGPKGLTSQNYGIVGCAKFDRNDPTLKTFYAGTGTSGLWKTTNGGLTWKNITGNYLVSGMGISDILIHPTNPDIIYIATLCQGLGRTYYYSNGIMKTTDGGQTWSYCYSLNPSDKTVISKMVMNPNNPNQIIAFGANQIFRTMDGSTWSPILNVPPNFCYSNNIID